MVNVKDYKCKAELLNSSNNRLGLDQTFFFTAVLFFIIGMGFGTSYSLVYVDCLDWVHTRLWKRLLRGVIGCGIVTGIFITLQLIPCNDNPTRFFFRYTVPALSLSFFTYGIFPIICKYLGLVDSTDSITVLNEDPIKGGKRQLIDSIEEEDENTTEQTMMLKSAQFGGAKN